MFIRLHDAGIYINLHHVKKYNPRRNNRIDYIDGTHDTLTDSDADLLVQAMFPEAFAKKEPAKRRTATKKVSTTN